MINHNGQNNQFSTCRCRVVKIIIMVFTPSPRLLILDSTFNTGRSQSISCSCSSCTGTSLWVSNDLHFSLVRIVYRCFTLRYFLLFLFADRSSLSPNFGFFSIYEQPKWERIVASTQVGLRVRIWVWIRVRVRLGLYFGCSYIEKGPKLQGRVKSHSDK